MGKDVCHQINLNGEKLEKTITHSVCCYYTLPVTELVKFIYIHDQVRYYVPVYLLIII